MNRIAASFAQLTSVSSTPQKYTSNRRFSWTKSHPDPNEDQPRLRRKRRPSFRYIAVRLALLFPIFFICSLTNAQTAFSNTSLTMAWSEDAQLQESQLQTLNSDIQGALNASASDFCFAIETSPANLLDFPRLNCTIGDASSPNGYSAEKASFALVLGDMAFDYDSGAAHSLTLTARETSATPSERTANSLRVTFTLSNVDEAPVLTDETFAYVAPPAHSRETRYLEVGDTFQYNIATLFRDPEGAPISLPQSRIEVCDTGVAGDFVEGDSSCIRYSDLPTTPDVLSVEARGPVLVAAADGAGMASAGVYWAKLYFGASDQTGNITTKEQGANVTVFVKQGVNNPPTFAGGASGFSVSVDEVAAGSTAAVAINPMPLGAWNATDLDGGSNSSHNDSIQYSLIGAQANCLNTGVRAVRIGDMCIALVQPTSGVALQGYFLDYESPHLSSTNSLTVTLRASDGWNDADITIEITLMNVNELYAHDDPRTESVLPMTVRLLQGRSRSFDLNSYFTDPEMDNVTYTVFANALTELVTHSGSSLTLTGVGTSASNPTVSDVVTVRATDGTIQLERTIQVEVRNSNTPPRFEPAGVIGVGGNINENVPLGTAVSQLVQYADDDSAADEIDVTLSSSDFTAIVDPIWDSTAMNVCEAESATCLRQPNRIAIVSAAPINFEATSTYNIALGLHDGWVPSDPNRNFTLTVTVNNVNDAPMAAGHVPDRSLSVQGTATFSAGQYFSDEDAGDRIIVSPSSSNPSAVSVTVQGADEITITGVALGTSTVTLTATDNAGLAATQSFQVTVQTNQSPVASAEAFTSALPANLEMQIEQIHDVPLSGLFTDPEGDDITVEVSSSAQDVLLAQVTGSGANAVAVLTARRVLGSADLTFTATDTAGNEATEVRTIEVVSELTTDNEAPEINQTALDAALPENNEIVLNRNIELTLTDIFTDPDGDELTFAVESSDPNVVLVNLASDGFSLFLFADAIGMATITITATDTADNMTSVEISFTVIEESTSDNQAPVLDQAAFAAALPSDNTMQQRNYHELDVSGLFTDPEGDALTTQVVSSNTTVLRISGAAGSATTFLIARGIGSSELSVTATDVEGNATTGTATIRVVANESDGENAPPVLDRDALTAALPTNNTLPVPEFFELELDTLFTDPNPNDSVAGYDVSSSDDGVLLVVLDPGNVLTAFARSAGTAMMTIVARDTEGAEISVTETITVTAPAANALVFGRQTFDRGAPLTLDVRDFLQDVDLRNATFNLQPTIHDASVLDASVDGSRLTLSALKRGETFVKLTVSNDAGYTARTMFFVNVVNAAPSLVMPLVDQHITRIGDLDLDLREAFQDADGEPVNVTAHTLDESVVATTFEDGVLTIQGMQVGETVVTLVAVDTNGATTEASFNVSVENIGPTVSESIGPIQLQVGGDAYDLAFNDWFTDADDPLTYSATLDKIGVVQATTTDTAATFTPLTKGNVALTVTASDPHGGLASFTAQIVVGDERLMEVAEQSLAGIGRAILGSVVSTIDTRTNKIRGNSDLSPDPSSADTVDAWAGLSLHYQLVPGSEFATSSSGGDSLPQLSDNWSSDSANHLVPHSFSPFDHGFSFSLGADNEADPWSVWSNMDRQSYGGENYGGSVKNTYLGVDKSVKDDWLIGLTVTQHKGESHYTYGTATQHLDVELHQLIPYFRYVPTDKQSVWGTIAVGRGNLGTTVVGTDDASSMLKSQLAAIGGRHRLTNSARFELAVRGDIAASRIATAEGESGSDDLQANIHRLRTGIETSYSLDLFTNTTFTPFGQLNLRADGGDGDTGSGLEFTGGLKVMRNAYSIEVMGRTFETRGEDAHSESGITMTATVNPSHDGTGLSASISPQWGTTVLTGDSIWQNVVRVDDGSRLLRNPDRSVPDTRMHLDAQIGYGFPVIEERFLLTPFIQHTKYGTGLQQSQFGAQLNQFVRANHTMSSRIFVGRSERYGEQDQSTYGLSVRLDF